MSDTAPASNSTTAPAATTESTQPAPAAETAAPPAATATAETAPESSSTQPPSPWNKAQIEEMSKSERIFKLALTEPYKAVCIRREIPDAKIEGHVARIITARNQTATAGASVNAIGGITLTEAEAEKELLTDIRVVQAAAKQKHARTNPEVLPDFMVGTDVTESRPVLEQTSQTLLSKVSGQHLPGLDTEFVSKMSMHREKYVDVNVAHGAQGVLAQQERMKRDNFIEEIKDARVEIQYAIEAEYPPTNPDNTPVRRLFDLPPNRPFHAVKRKSA